MFDFYNKTALCACYLEFIFFFMTRTENGKINCKFFDFYCDDSILYIYIIYKYENNTIKK